MIQKNRLRSIFLGEPLVRRRRSVLQSFKYSCFIGSTGSGSSNWFKFEFKCYSWNYHYHTTWAELTFILHWHITINGKKLIKNSYLSYFVIFASNKHFNFINITKIKAYGYKNTTIASNRNSNLNRYSSELCILSY